MSTFDFAATFVAGMASAFIACGAHVLRVNRRMLRTEERNTWEREQRNNAIKSMDVAHIRNEELIHENVRLQRMTQDLVRENDTLSRALHGRLEPAPILAVMEGRKA